MSDLQKLRQFFESNKGRSIPLPRLGKVMSPYSVTKRISELRQRGMIIRNAVQTVKGRRHSTYRYVG